MMSAPPESFQQKASCRYLPLAREDAQCDCPLLTIGKRKETTTCI